MSLLEVRELQTYFDTRRGVVKAVDGISFALESGKGLGIVGESGSGKSQTAMSIIKLFQRNQRIAGGSILFDGKVISDFSEEQLEKVRGNEISIIFQEPMSSLNPVFSVNRQLTEVLTTHQKMSKEEAQNKAYEMLKAVKIDQPERVLKSYPHQLSGGMSQRVMIAMALACNPKLLIADEPTTALDVITQAEILKLMNELKEKFNTAILFITHDLGVVSKMVDNIVVMHGGKIVESAPTKELFRSAKHPYTKRLIAAFLKTDIRRGQKQPSLNFFEAENDQFDFESFRTKGVADGDYLEVSPGHTIACRIKSK
jgi:peptide/nickel transport system ATP-binding protein